VKSARPLLRAVLAGAVLTAASVPVDCHAADQKPAGAIPAAHAAADANTSQPGAATASQPPGANVPQPVNAAPQSIRRATVRGAITPATVDYLEGAIESARAEGAAALVIVLDTPGGLLDSTKLVVQDLLAAPIPVLVYVSPGGASATSAGVFVTMAAHIAAMAPGTSIGAAHPVGAGGEDIKGTMAKKVENFTAAFGSAIADRRGRNVEWAEKAVRESVTATEKDAVANRIVDFVAADLAELLHKAKGREVEVLGKRQTLDFEGAFDAAGEPRVVDIAMTLRQRVVAFVSDPNVAYLLMIVAMLSIYVEMSHPGLILPGVAGAICLLLVLLAAQILPIRATGGLLMLVGMAFLVAELFYPSFGSLGVGGIIALALGSLFLYTPESGLEVDRRLIFAAVGSLAAFVALIVLVLMTDRRRQPAAGMEGMIGEIGTALSDLAPTGTIKVRGEIWNAASSAPITAGQKVRIVKLRGLQAQVVTEEPAEPERKERTT